MPPRIPSVRALRALRAHAESRPLACSSRYSVAAPALLPRRPQLRASRQAEHARRGVSHAAPVTSVNAVPSVQPAFRELHGAFTALEGAAANYASLSQVRLALRGLEAENPVVRVAVLGVGRPELARRLVRALLADPLGETQAWEDALTGGDGDGRAILVQYGDEFSLDERNPLLRTVRVPATLLRKHGIELLVHYTGATKAANGDIDAGVSALLRLELGTRSSGSRPEALLQAHKTLVVDEGTHGAELVFSLLSKAEGESSDLVHGSVSLGVEGLSSEMASAKVSLVNIQEAEAAVQAFRKSLENSFIYERGWLGSNIEAASAFLTAGTSSDPDSTLKPALKAQASLTLRGTEAAIEREESERLAELLSSSLNPEAQAALRQAIESWAEFAHTELRDALANAQRSAAWRKLRWWSLPWRVDDVGLLANDVLQRAYLVNAERHLLWIAGYFRACGLVLAEHGSGDLTRASHAAAGPSSQRWFDALPKGQDLRDMYLEQEVNGPAKPRVVGGEEDTIVVPPALSDLNPWPQQLARSRARLQAEILPLHAAAQAVLTRALSEGALAGTLAALVWVGGAGAYGAGSVAALGGVLAVRAAQGRWERARDKWLDGVRREGKEVLERVARRGREAVDEAVRAGEERVRSGGDGARDRQVARELVRRAREALDKL